MNYPEDISYRWYQLYKQGHVVHPDMLMQIPDAMWDDAAIWAETERWVQAKWGNDDE